MIKSRRMQCTEHIVRKGETRITSNKTVDFIGEVHFGGTGVDGSIILKCVLKEWSVKLLAGFS